MARLILRARNCQWLLIAALCKATWNASEKFDSQGNPEHATIVVASSYKNKPVFVLHLMKPASFHFISARREADMQIRKRLGDLAGRSPISTLHAVSAMGSRLCFYHMDTTDVEPVIISLNVPYAPRDDTAPMERWDCDVLDAVGEARLRAGVDSVKAACANIADA